MKIEFSDGSYLEVVLNNGSTRVIMCGRKSNQELTMSISDLNKDQLKQLADYLTSLSV